MKDALSVITEKKNLVLLGETGSGKTETGINMALAMAREGLEVHYFDLDQTKPLFRARELAGQLEKGGVVLHYQEQDLDTPTVADGIIEALCDEKKNVILDIGGGSHGSHMIGQFAHILNGSTTEVFYLINPYRIWSLNAQDIQQTVQRVAGAARLEHISLAANPNLGADTAAADVLAGLRRIHALLPDDELKLLCVKQELADVVKPDVDIPVFPLTIFTTPEWI